MTDRKPELSWKDFLGPIELKSQRIILALAFTPESVERADWPTEWDRRLELARRTELLARVTLEVEGPQADIVVDAVAEFDLGREASDIPSRP